jgi:hypothetical protein
MPFKITASYIFGLISIIFLRGIVYNLLYMIHEEVRSDAKIGDMISYTQQKHVEHILKTERSSQIRNYRFARKKLL